MSLINALSQAQYGIASTERKLGATSSNIANADREGYSRKTYTDAGSLNSGSVTGVVQRLLQRQVTQEASTSGYSATMSEYLAHYDDALGSTDGDSGANAALNEMIASLQTLASSTDNSGATATTISDLENLTYQLRSQSASIQTLRQQADAEMATSVETINQLVRDIHVFNTQIRTATDDTTRANLEDSRSAALDSLSQQMGVSYFYTDDNAVHIYTPSGQPLLNSVPHALSFTATGTVTDTNAYPGSLSGVTLDGTDITASIRGGSLDALITLRDETLVYEQQALDNAARTLIDEMNAIHNRGAAIPAPLILTGSAGFAAADPIVATGTLRIATTDANGVVQDVLDIDLTTITDVNDLIAALNTVPNVSANLTADGRLQIASTDPDLGIALSEMDSDVSGQGMSDYFGLNDLFDTDSMSASTIYLRSDISEDRAYLAAGALSQSATLASGDTGIAPGDGSIAQAMADLFDTTLSFAAAGDVVARSDTLVGYMQYLASLSAQRISAAASANDTAQQSYQSLKDYAQNKSGVNVDEELTNVTVLQNAYSANAQVISVVKEMFETLMAALR